MIQSNPLDAPEPAACRHGVRIDDFCVDCEQTKHPIQVGARPTPASPRTDRLREIDAELALMTNQPHEPSVSVLIGLVRRLLREVGT